MSIFGQGDRADQGQSALSGEIDTVRVFSDGTDEITNRLHAGQYFGELGPLLGFPRSGRHGR